MFNHISGDYSGTSDGSFSEGDPGPSPIWCVTCKGNLIIAGCGNGRIEVGWLSEL